MGQKDKLLNRLCSHPKDFSFDEVEKLLSYYGYHRINKGKTSGSRIAYISDRHYRPILMHKPHGRKDLLDYQVKQLVDHLKQEGLI